MEAQDYAKKAYQWAKALRLLDPKIQLISCGGKSTCSLNRTIVNIPSPETGYADWDRVTLKKLAPVVDYHSIHSTLCL